MNFYKSSILKPYLTTHTLAPENQETPIHHIKRWVTPRKYVYRRNHFSYPTLTPNFFLLSVEGKVKHPLIFNFNTLLSMPSTTAAMVLECSGNKRSYFDPKVYGEQWKDGAISQGIWKGVPLRHLLTLAGLESSVKEVVFEGHDYGPRTDLEGIFSYARSLPLDKALHPDTLIAYELNGKPIPFKHGYPLRLIVPQWYGMASVKWLKRITVIDHEFRGPFQAIDYVYYPHKEDNSEKRPVTNIHVNSTIQQPMPYQLLDTGTHKISGIAYSGEGKIQEVKLSFDGGKTWDSANLKEPYNSPYSWTFWDYTWKVNEKGEYIIMSRAKDSKGNIQPLKAEWNRRGYGYNAIYAIKVKVE
ncbi:molybdopterin-dependent oxidoreductase [Clostridium bovifaecis]|uniref:Molybdopterin-dependent oxidoreductase n=1 Tax=Clostridium bovifaecis TaxID=2184719 RepID=A0A6I6EY78_9CLOT|nr:molybdopterin-dependent oxidoreductase [Clostridium bovifaecis]